MIPKHIKLLKELSHNGVGYTNNIVPFLLSEFPSHGGSSAWLWDRDGKAALLFLQDLYYRGLIRFSYKDEEEQDTMPFLPHDLESYKDYIIDCYITSQGLDYLDAHEQSLINRSLNTSYVNINRASLKNYRNQLIIGAITIALAASSAYMSYQSNHKADQTAISVDSLRLEIRKWRTEKIQMPVPSTSQTGVRRKH